MLLSSHIYNCIQNIIHVFIFHRTNSLKSLENNPALKQGSSSSKDLAELKHGLVAAIGAGNGELERNVATLDYTMVVYHLGMLHTVCT